MIGRAPPRGLAPGLALAVVLLTGNGVFAQMDAAVDSLDIWLSMLGVGPDAADVRPAVEAAGWDWSGTLGTGYDTFVQTYALALEDTTDTLSEFEVGLGLDGATTGPVEHRLSVAPRVVLGSERTRETLDAGWSWRPDRATSVLDVGVDLEAVQYGDSSDWDLSSDWRRADLDVRGRLSPRGATMGEVRLDAGRLRYDDPSELEVDRDDWRLRAALRSGLDADLRWRLGVRLGRRTHPDTAAIDRRMRGVEGEIETFAFDGPDLRLAHRSERRTIADETVRPSNWAHWTDTEAVLPMGEDVELTAVAALEIWDYDETWSFYQSQTRAEAEFGLRRSVLGGAGWSLAGTWEHLDSDDPEETYAQTGLRGGLEIYDSALNASLTLEVGRRDYEADDGDPPPVTASVADEPPLYTDFTYVELWLSAAWRLDERLTLDALASYLPESHSDDENDQSLGFASVRATYSF